MPCQDFCCPAFAKNVDGELTGRNPDLVYPIHPIFRRINFNGPNGGILSPLDYTILKPSLQLASLFLESDSMVLFLIKLFDGDVQTGNGLSVPRSMLMVEHPEGGPLFQAWDVHAAFYSGQGELSAHNRNRAAQILTMMADVGTFRLDGDHDEPGLEGSAQIAHASLNHALHNFFLWGCRSVICINHPLGKIKTALRKLQSLDQAYIAKTAPLRSVLCTQST